MRYAIGYKLYKQYQQSPAAIRQLQIFSCWLSALGGHISLFIIIQR